MTTPIMPLINATPLANIVTPATNTQTLKFEITIGDAPAEAATTAAPAQPSTASTVTMETFRELQFRQRVVSRLREAVAAKQPLESVIAAVALEEQALAGAITDPEFVALAGNQLHEEKTKVSPQFASDAAHERGVMQEILERRAEESKARVAQLSDAKFVESLFKEAQGNDNTVVPNLRDVKLGETVMDLLRRDEKGVAQVGAHIDGDAWGLIGEHSALNQLFAPEGALHKPLMKGLQDRGIDETRAHTYTLEWLGDRKAAADTTVELAQGEAKARAHAIEQQEREAAKKSVVETVVAAAPAQPVSHADRALASKSNILVNQI